MPLRDRIRAERAGRLSRAFVIRERNSRGSETFAVTITLLSFFSLPMERLMNGIIYLVGLVVVVMAILSFVGIR
jgi:hypothetical protein